MDGTMDITCSFFDPSCSSSLDPSFASSFVDVVFFRNDVSGVAINIFDA